MLATLAFEFDLCGQEDSSSTQHDSATRSTISDQQPVRATITDQGRGKQDSSQDDLDSLLDLDIADLGKVVAKPSPFSSDREVSGADRQMVADSAMVNVISGGEASTRNTTDVGSLLGKSTSNPGVYIQQRSPIISDPRIRGFRIGQYLAQADGAVWYPARSDIDSILSKVDSKMIDDVMVINGPYSARYGPGFSFIDVVTRPTPRYENGAGAGGNTYLTYNGNGQQWSGGQYLENGGRHWGASIYYGHQVGSDYFDGAGNRVPSSYKSRSVNFAFGFDVTDRTTIEFKYLRQDQTDVELAGQFTDIDFLVTDGFAINIESRDQGWADLVSSDVWYNRTRSEGSGGRASKQSLFNTVFNISAPNGGLTLPRGSETDFDLASMGFTYAMTWGQAETLQSTLGTDLRHYETSLNEVQIRPAGSGGFQSATEDVVALVPESQSSNPGIFAEVLVPVSERLKLKGGARVDWVSISAGPGDIVRRGGTTKNLDVIGPDRENSYNLWSAYVTGDYSLSETLSANVGVGFAQRPPTSTELFAQRPFASVLQQGLNRVQGYPFLDPERLKQVDIGLNSKTETFRGGVRGFHAWIDDYITSQGFAVDPTSDTMRIASIFVNTPRATLAGGEAFGEWDLSRRTTFFGSLAYVEGRNHTLNELLFDTPSLPEPPGSKSGKGFGRGVFDQGLGQEPLPQIAPLESRLGIRFQNRADNPTLGTELLARIVDNQDRLASGSLLEEPTPGFTTFDFRGYYRPTKRHTVIFGVLNFTDKQYREHLDNRAGNQLFQPGITGYVGSEVSY